MLNLATKPRFALASIIGIIAGVISALCLLRDYIGIADPNAAIYEFAGHAFNYVMLTHIIFLVVFAVGHCIVAEKFPKITMWQGVLAGILANITIHVISLPILGITPPLWTLPWYEHVSEFIGHMVWFWSIEIIRHDLKARITKEKDPSDCCCCNT